MSMRGAGRLQMARLSRTRSTMTTLAAEGCPARTVTPLTSTPSSASPSRMARPLASSPTVPTKAARTPSRDAATAAVAAGPPPAYTTSEASHPVVGSGEPVHERDGVEGGHADEDGVDGLGELVGLVAMASRTPSSGMSTMLRL